MVYLTGKGHRIIQFFDTAGVSLTSVDDKDTPFLTGSYTCPLNQT